MEVPSRYRRPARGRPLIGFQLDAPGEVELREGAILSCREVRQDGQMVGELEVSVFSAALVIDRDGILAEKACDTLDRVAQVRGSATAVAVQLPGASGFRADAVRSAPLPYVHVFAIAPQDLGVDGGVLVTIRCARPDWPAGDHMLRSLRIVTRNGIATANDDAEAAPLLLKVPLAGMPRMRG